MTVKVAIMGFGRMGPDVLRAIVLILAGVADRSRFFSSAAGALLDRLEGRTLPGVAARMQDERV